MAIEGQEKSGETTSASFRFVPLRNGLSRVCPLRLKQQVESAWEWILGSDENNRPFIRCPALEITAELEQCRLVDALDIRKQTFLIYATSCPLSSTVNCYTLAATGS